MGTVGSEDQSCQDKMTSLVIPCLVMVAAAAQGHTLSKRSAVHAVPVVSTPAIATSGYAVGASGAVGGQAPATIAAPAPVVAYAGALPVVHHSAVAIASHAIPAAHHSVPTRLQLWLFFCFSSIHYQHTRSNHLLVARQYRCGCGRPEDFVGPEEARCWIPWLPRRIPGRLPRPP